MYFRIPSWSMRHGIQQVSTLVIKSVIKSMALTFYLNSLQNQVPKLCSCLLADMHKTYTYFASRWASDIEGDSSGLQGLACPPVATFQGQFIPVCLRSYSNLTFTNLPDTSESICNSQQNRFFVCHKCRDF